MKKILIIEDDHVSILLMKKVISRIGNAVPITDASNGESAIEILHHYFQTVKSLPDYILLDLNMPMMNGFEFLETLPTLKIPGIDKIKVIVVSSTLNEQDITRSMQLGAHKFLPKPLEYEPLRTILTA